MNLLKNLLVLLSVFLMFSCGKEDVVEPQSSTVEGLIVNDVVVPNDSILVIHCEDYEWYKKPRHYRVYQIFTDDGNFYLHLNTPQYDGQSQLENTVCETRYYGESVKQLEDNESFAFIYDDDNISHCLTSLPTITKNGEMIDLGYLTFDKSGDSDLSDVVTVTGNVMCNYD